MSILVIMGSVRQGRRCPEIAGWVVETAKASTDLELELIDLGDWTLPLDDEPGIPARDAYTQAHTLAWSRKVNAARGFIIVTPQYNWGYPAALKNALDHVYAEWAAKPVVIVSYGGHGGTKCADQLRQVCEGLKMAVVPVMPAITLTHEMIAGGPIAPAADFAAYAMVLQQALAGLSALVAG